jgi:hypothetical protein
MISAHLNRTYIAVGIILCCIKLGDSRITALIGITIIVIELMRARKLSKDLSDYPPDTIIEYYKKDPANKYLTIAEKTKGIKKLFDAEPSPNNIVQENRSR